MSGNSGPQHGVRPGEERVAHDARREDRRSDIRMNDHRRRAIAARSRGHRRPEGERPPRRRLAGTSRRRRRRRRSALAFRARLSHGARRGTRVEKAFAATPARPAAAPRARSVGWRKTSSLDRSARVLTLRDAARVHRCSARTNRVRRERPARVGVARRAARGSAAPVPARRPRALKKDQRVRDRIAAFRFKKRVAPPRALFR